MLDERPGEIKAGHKIYVRKSQSLLCWMSAREFESASTVRPMPLSQSLLCWMSARERIARLDAPTVMSVSQSLLCWMSAREGRAGCRCRALPDGVSIPVVLDERPGA